MPTAENDVLADQQDVRDEWLERLSALVTSIQTWAEEFGWSTRMIDKQLEDSQIGAYQGPALLLQKETTRALLEPVARSAPGAEGVVDLYRMPAYDDIASLYYCNGAWHLYYMSPGMPDRTSRRDTESTPLSKESLQAVLEEMGRNGA